MSGGSLDYVSYKVENAMSTIAINGPGSDDPPLYMAFVKHLQLVTNALHEIEWVLSCDNSPGKELSAMRKVITPAMELTSATEIAKEALAWLTKTIESVEGREK